MAWRIEFKAEAKKEFAHLYRKVQDRIRRFLRERIAASDNPRDFGEPLRRNVTGLWKYRVGDYRIIAEIVEEMVLVVVLRICHRRKVL